MAQAPDAARRSLIMEWLLALAVLAIGVPAAAWLAQDSLIFLPQPGVPAATMPSRAQPLELTTGAGLRLRGWVLPGTSERSPTILYFGGNAEEVSWTLADPRWPAQWTVAALNYRGYGASEGRPGEPELVADALLLFDAMSARADVDASRVVAFGRSLGAGVAVRLAAQRPLAGVILASPFDSLVALGRHHYPFLPVSLLLRHRFEAIRLAPGASSPLHVVVAAADAVVPPAFSRRLYEAWAGRKSWQVVPGTDHNSLSVPDAFWDGVRRFLATLEPAVQAGARSAAMPEGSVQR